MSAATTATTAIEGKREFKWDVSQWYSAQRIEGASSSNDGTKGKTLPKLDVEPELRKVNVALLFQVGCPPCVFNALPTANKLYQEYEQKGLLRIFAISTVFETPDINNEDNTLGLFRNGYLTPACACTFEDLCEENEQITDPGEYFEYLTTFEPFALGIDRPTIKRPTNATATTLRVSASAKEPTTDVTDGKQVAVASVEGNTFSNVGATASPTWVIFDDKRQILDMWAGESLPDSLRARLKPFL